VTVPKLKVGPQLLEDARDTSESLVMETEAHQVVVMVEDPKMEDRKIEARARTMQTIRILLVAQAGVESATMTVDNTSKPPNPVYSLNISKRIQQGSPLLVPASLVPAHNRECILGKRRIWGTLKSCSALTVKIALQRLTAMSEKVTVKGSTSK